MLPRLLEKYSSWITLGLLALLAYLQAWGVTALLAATLIGAPTPAPPPKPLSKHPSASSVLHRSPLDVLTPPLDQRAATPVERLAALRQCEQAAAATRPSDPTGPAPTRASSAQVAPLSVARSLASADDTRLGSLLSHVRIVPEIRDGTPVGVRLFGIGPDSVLALLGLENGDCLRAINDRPLATPSQALEAYVELQRASWIALSIQRGGKPLTLRYQLI